MDIKIRSLLDKKGDNERIVLDVVKKTQLGRFIIFDTTYDEDGVESDKNRHSFIFPSKDVEEGDIIILYTKKGKNRTTTNQKGVPLHFFYWGLDCKVWNNNEDEALLVHVDDFERKPFK